MSLVSPLNRVLGLGSAKEGTEHWWGQRLSAIALVGLGLWFAGAALDFGEFDYASVSSWIAQPLHAVLLSLLVLTLAYHSQLGIQIVVEDYVHATGFKIATLIVLTFLHIIVAAVGVFAVFKLAFGAPA
jgi:succinate dehydrogenase / fumarate reductase membrane anchor subunit